MHESDALDRGSDIRPSPSVGHTCAVSNCQGPAEASRDRLVRELLSYSQQDLLCRHRRFIPNGSICNILTEQKVDSHLRHFLPENLCSHLAKEIAPEASGNCGCQKATCTGKRVILASLLRIGREDYIQSFCQSATNICDSKLPLDNESLSQASAAGQGLSEKERELFENAQWQIRSHYLTGSGVDEPGVVKLDDGAVLPLMKRRDIRKGRASGSKEAKPIPVFPENRVSEIEIHPDHHDLHKMNGKSNIFVLKTFRHPRDPEIAEEDFKAELLANRQLPRHERIVPLLAAFEFENEFHLIFPFARQGDLESLWERTKMLPKDPLPGWYSPQWLLRECLGIVEALAETHSPTLPINEAGSIVWVPQLHADIKARNILCFQPNDQAPPFLKLADFGCSQRAGEDGAFNINGGLPHTKTYRPPERDIENFVGLNYDVWCLGCLYLDFITWAIIGYKGIEDFNESRMEEKNDKYVSKARGNDAEDIFFKKLARLPRWYDASALRFQSQRTEKLYKNTAFAQRSFTFSRGVIKIGCDIKISVIQHINTLQVNGQCQPEFQKLLKIIENDMLVVERQKRASSSKIKSLLQEVVRP